MSHVKRDGKCYDLNYQIRNRDGLEAIGYSFIVLCTVILAAVSLLVDWRLAVGVVVIGCMVLGYNVYTNRPTPVDLSPSVAKEVQCPPSDYDYNKQAGDIQACMDSKLPDCERLKLYNIYVSV